MTVVAVSVSIFIITVTIIIFAVKFVSIWVDFRETVDAFFGQILTELCK